MEGNYSIWLTQLVNRWLLVCEMVLWCSRSLRWVPLQTGQRHTHSSLMAPLVVNGSSFVCTLNLFSKSNLAIFLDHFLIWWLKLKTSKVYNSFLYFCCQCIDGDCCCCCCFQWYRQYIAGAIAVSNYFEFLVSCCWWRWPLVVISGVCLVASLIHGLHNM